MSTLTKAKRKTWYTAEDKDFLLKCKERAIADLLEDSPVFMKKVFKILPLRQIAKYAKFIRAVFVLDETCSCKWYSSRFI